MSLKHGEVTELVLKAYFEVYNELRYGFLGKVYENALAMILRGYGLGVLQQAPVRVHFRGRLIGEYYADLLVGDLVIVEIKAARAILPEHEAQLLNYLKATPYEVGLLLNFGPVPQHLRRVMDNSRKGSLVSGTRIITDLH